MSTIYYNSAVARLCGNNGIIKAVLLQYIYNYHKPNIRKGAGTPACIKLAEFVYRYTSGDKPLWCRSYIHKILKDLETDEHLFVAREGILPVYTVSDDVAALLQDIEPINIGFNLELACKRGIHIAIVGRHLVHMIKKSPDGIAYHIDVNEMAELNHLSPAQIYRAIGYLQSHKILNKTQSPRTFPKRGMNLMRSSQPRDPNLLNMLS